MYEEWVRTFVTPSVDAAHRPNGLPAFVVRIASGDFDPVPLGKRRFDAPRWEKLVDEEAAELGTRVAVSSVRERKKRVWTKPETHLDFVRKPHGYQAWFGVPQERFDVEFPKVVSVERLVRRGAIRGRVGPRRAANGEG